jgi:HSP20 family protein
MKETAEKTNAARETSESTQPNQSQTSAGMGQGTASASAKTGSQQSQQPEQKAGSAQSSQRQADSSISPTTNRGQTPSQSRSMWNDWSMPTRWMENPFGLMRRFSEEVDRLFEEFGLGRGLRSWRSGQGREQGQAMWSPQIEMYERDNHLVICADLPGLKKDDIQVEITENTLTLHGERHQEFEDAREGYRRSERSYGSFYRAISLPEGVNAEQAEANFQDGVLKITFPLPQERKQRRRIDIQSADASSATRPKNGNDATTVTPR